LVTSEFFLRAKARSHTVAARKQAIFAMLSVASRAAEIDKYIYGFWIV
jgi:hypothetical protein